MERLALRAFVRGQEEAAARARDVRAGAGPVDPSEAFDRAMALWALRPELASRPRTPVEEAHIASARAAWMQIKARWAP